MAKSRRNNGSRRNKTRRKQNPFMMFMKKFRKENKGLSFKDMGREGGKSYRKMRGGGDTTTAGQPTADGATVSTETEI